MTESQIQSVALFYLLAFLDERLAARATLKAVQDLKKYHAKKSKETQANYQLEPHEFVWFCFKHWIHYKKYQENLPTSLLTSGAWTMPKSFDLGPWRQFRKECQESELLAVIWCHVLGFGPHAVSKGLDVSEGSVHYRISNGLKLLGMATLGGIRV